MSNHDDYNPLEWKRFSTLKMIQFLYAFSNDICEKITKTKVAKELLETVKNVKFDIIVQDVTTSQCLYGLWEVSKFVMDDLWLPALYRVRHIQNIRVVKLGVFWILLPSPPPPINSPN